MGSRQNYWIILLRILRSVDWYNRRCVHKKESSPNWTSRKLLINPPTPPAFFFFLRDFFRLASKYMPFLFSGYKMEYSCLNVAFCIMVLMDLAGNTLVILVIRLNKSMRTPMNMLLLNLAVADMVVAVFVAIQFVIGPTFQHPSGTTGLWLCKFVTGGTMTWSAAAVSVGNLVAISIERWIVYVSI